MWHIFFLLVPLRSGHDCIHNFDNSVQGRVRSNCHVGAAEVVVDGPHHSDDVQGVVLLRGLFINVSCPTGQKKHSVHRDS